MMKPPRIALIHATPLAVSPINDSFKNLWPQAICQNLLDDSLSVDLARDGELTEAMIKRFLNLTHYTLSAGADAILFTCSAFGVAIEACAKESNVPVLKPNEAMFDEALSLARTDKKLKVALLVTFNPSIASMSEELNQMAKAKAIDLDLVTAHVPVAMQHLANGDAQKHHDLIAQTAAQLPPCDVILLAQFSMAAAKQTVSEKLKNSNLPVLSSPVCAVQALQKALGFDTHIDHTH